MLKKELQYWKTLQNFIDKDDKQNQGFKEKYRYLTTNHKLR